MYVIRQIIRGVGTLDHVGEHPGTKTLMLFVALGAVAGLRNTGLTGALVCAVGMLLGLGPIYLWGAYDRACIADAKEMKKVQKAKAQASQ